MWDFIKHTPQTASLLILYPHQLYPLDELPKDVDQVILVEDPLYFGTDQQYPLYLHKQKLVLHRATMRRYIEEVLWPAGLSVDYIEFHQMQTTGDIANRLAGAQTVTIFDPTDDMLLRRFRACVDALPDKPKLRVYESPNFYLTASEVKQFFQKKGKANFSEFYRWQRERFNILIDPETYRPVGGKLSFDTDNRKRLPKNHKLPGFAVYGTNKFVDEAKQYVERLFPDNPGYIEDFPWPTNHEESVAWLDEFLETRFDHFGPYEDAIDGQAPWVYHSGISPMLNIGLLSPVEVVQKALDRHARRPVPLESLEGFIRQIIGWREYMRGMYVDRHVALRTKNVFEHKRRMTNDWYNGTTGMPPLDDVIKKTLTRAYAHHIERLMVVGNMMFLCELDPSDIYRWFMEMYIDAYDWVMVPNVYGMSQYADGGSMTTKPYVSGSNYIRTMSFYEKGEWCDAWDGLYWRFIEKNRDRFAKNPRMKVVVQQLDHLDEGRRRILQYRSDDFLMKKTREDTADSQELPAKTV